MSNNISNNSEKSILNLLAIGGFLWYFTITTAHLSYLASRVIGIVTGANPHLFFWLNEVVYLAVIFLIARFATKTTWSQVLDGTLNSKSILTKLGIGIAIVFILQFLYGFYITDYLFSNHNDALTQLREVGSAIDPHGLTGFTVDFLGTILLLVIIVKRK